MDGVVAYILGKSYVKKSLIGIGALAGAPCQVQSINKVGKTTTVTLKWEDNVGGVHTQAFDIEDGADGVSVVGATINANGHLILTLSNTNTIDCGQVLPQYDTMPVPSASNEGQILQYIGTTTSSFTNGYFYICESDGLGGYHWVQKLVQDSYTKAQIGDISDLPDNTKNVVENIGNLKLSIDQLSASKLSISDIDDELSDTSENPVQNKVITLAIDQLQGSMLDALAGKEDIFRYNTLPAPSVDIVNAIVQYIGATNANYTNGYYYQCVESPVGSGTYVWVQKNVQPSSGSGGGDDVIDGYYNTNDYKFYEEPTYVNEIIGETGKIYISDDTNIQYRWDGTQFVTISSSIEVDDELSTTSENPVQNKVLTQKIDDIELLLGSKVDKETGKGLSTNDFTDEYKDKVVALKPIYMIGSGLVLDDSDPTSPTYGKLSATGISIPIDDELSDTSVNPVQNKVITLAIDQLQGSVLEKIQKKLSANADDFAVFTNDGDIADSGISKNVVPNTVSVSNKLLVASDLSVKADKVSGATNDDIALLDGTGNLKDSTKKLSDLQDKLTEGDGIDIDANNKISLKVDYLTASRVGYIPATEKGAYRGVAELDATGKVPSSQLPSYVDDVIDGYYNEIDGKFYEESTYTTEIVGESGKIYISVDTDIQYRWTGSAFAALGGALQLGETASTAYRGDRGKIAYDHSQIKDGSNPHETKADAINLKVPIPALSGSKLDVESTLYGVNTALGTKADKVASAVSGHLAGLDGNGNLTDSGIVASNVIEKVTTATGLLKDDGSVDTTTYAPSNKAYLTDDTAETTLDDTDYVPFYDTSATAKKKTLFSTIKSFLKTYFDGIYTSKVVPSANGNFASLDTNGNLTDSGKKASDFAKKTIFDKNISTVGWVTIAKISDKYAAKGSVTEPFFIYLDSVYTNTTPQSTIIAICPKYQDVSYAVVVHNGICLTKIRKMYSIANDDAYIQVYYNVSVENRIRAYVSGSAFCECGDFTSVDLTGYTLQGAEETIATLPNLQSVSAKADLTDLAPAFNSASAYAIGAYVTYNGDLYRFTSAHMAGDPWSSSEVTQVTVGSELGSISSIEIAPTPSGSLTESTVVDTVNSAINTNNNAPSLFTVQKYSNEKTVRRVLNGANIPSGTSMTATGIGTWFDGDISTIVPSTDEADWWYDSAFIVPVYYVLTSDTSIVTGKTYYTRSGTAPNYTYTVVASPVVADIGTYYEQYSDDIELSFKFDPSSGEPTALGGYILDTTTGKLCIKFANSITPLKARIAVDITYTRNEVV